MVHSVHKHTLNRSSRGRASRQNRGEVVHVLDTCALMNDPELPVKSGKDTALICGIVQNELDGISHTRNKSAKKAKMAISRLAEIVRSQLRKSPNQKRSKKHGRKSSKVIIDSRKPKVPCLKKYPLVWDYERKDHMILMVCIELLEKGRNVTLVTCDNSLFLFVTGAKIEVEVRLIKPRQ